MKLDVTTGMAVFIGFYLVSCNLHKKTNHSGMHNVSEEKLFRPTDWNAFGSNPEDADFRACATYGPLYK